MTPLLLRTLGCLLLLLPLLARPAEPVAIGVLTRGGPADAQRWLPLADYLSEALPDHRFRIVPRTFHELPAAVARDELAFFITNPAQYVDLEVRQGALAIATLRNLGPDGEPRNRFGAVLFTRADAPAIRQLTDLRGRRFAAVDESGLGGFIAALGELHRGGLDPFTDFAEVRFVGTHEAVVEAVLSGRSELGTVRTDTLERMAAQGKLRLDALRPTHLRGGPDFPLLRSTDLYPEWPFARAHHTPPALTEAVAQALLALPADHPAARTARSAGWSAPLDYQPVHDLLRELRLSPYAQPPDATELLRRHRAWLIAGGVVIAGLLLINARFARLNRRLRRSEAALLEARDHLTEKVEERTATLAHTLAELRESHTRLDLALRDWNDAFDAINDPIFIHDRDLRLLHANPAYLARAGRSLAEVQGRPYFEVWPLLPGPLAACREYPERLAALPEELTLADGSVLISRSFGIRRSDGQVENAIHMLQDVTALRRAEAHRRILARAVEQAGEGVVIVRHDLTIGYCNPAFAQLLGLPAESLEGRGFRELLAPAERSRLPEMAPWSATAENWSGELLLLPAGRAEPLPVYLTGGDIADERGAVQGHVLTCVDLRPFKEAEAELNHRLRFESLVAAIAARFVALPRPAPEEGLARSLEELAQLLAADRVYFYRAADQGTRLRRAGCYCCPSCPPLGADREEIPLERLDPRLAEGHPRRLDPGAAADAAPLPAADAHAALLVPLLRDGRLTGLLGVESGAAHTPWDEQDIGLLQAVGGILESALIRAETEAAILRSQASLAESQRVARLGNWEWDIVAGTLAWSDEIYRIFGVEPQEFGATYEAFLSYVHPQDRPAVIAAVDDALYRDRPYAIDHRIVLGDGRERRVHEIGVVHFDTAHRPVRMLGTVQDVTEAREVERELRRLNRALRALSRSNAELVRAGDEAALLKAVCGVLIEEGGYRFAWVGYAEQEAPRRVRPVAWAGFEAGYLTQVESRWEPGDPLGDGPVGTAIRDGRAVVVRDALADPRFAPWRAEAVGRGCASVISLPLLDAGRAFGTLTIEAAEPDAFDPRELTLLYELAGDLAYGITALRTRDERTRAQAELAASEERYHSLYENAPAAYASLAAGDGRLSQWNRAFAALLGLPREALGGRALPELCREPAEGRQLLARLREGEAVRNEELELRDGAGQAVWVSLSMDPVPQDKGGVTEVRASFSDITERKRAAQERQAFAERLSRALLSTIQAISLTIEKRDPYTAGHQQRVSELAVAIARELELPKERIEGIRLGALVHDIGKIYVPTEILNRPGRLDAAQVLLVRAHPQVGYEIVQGIEFPWPIAEMVVQHHERLDGSGYPLGIQGEAIILEARILAVADVVEAMASHRPYRPALSLEEALGEIERHQGSWFDPQVTQACLDLFRKKGFSWEGRKAA